jgi:O-antigen/teichoic acid export membrane protein
VCGLSALWGLRGAVAGFLVHELVVLLVSGWLSFSRQGAVGVSLRAGLLVDIVKVGFPITIVWWVLILQNSVDRVVLGSLIGPTAVGHYGLGLSVAGLLAVVPMALARVLYPQVNRAFGKVTDVESMKRLLANMQLLILALLPFLYNRVLPKYGPGLAAGQVLVIGTFFICLLRNGANYLIAINEQRAFLKYVLITLIVNLAADICLINMGFGLSGVAFGTSLAGFILTTCVWRRVLHHLKFGRLESWSKLAVLYMPCLLVTIGVMLLRVTTQRPFMSASFETILLFGIVTVLFNATLCCLPPYRGEIARFLRVLQMPHRNSDIPPSASALPSAG